MPAEVVFFVPIVVFLVIVLPLWLILHYITRWRATKVLSTEDEKMLVDLWQSAKSIENRVSSLETILDAEVPNWRRR